RKYLSIFSGRDSRSVFEKLWLNRHLQIDFTCCTLPFGCVSLIVSLPRTAFRLGEGIEAQVTVNNRTRKGLKECALQLCMKTQFEAMSRKGKGLLVIFLIFIY
ncbi:unnamed protein product, partial [Cylicostephanus goldi]